MTSATKALLTQATRRAAVRFPSAAAATDASVSEISLTLADGMVLAGQRWTYTNDGRDDANRQQQEHQSQQQKQQQQQQQHGATQRILALHGWLDNCASFHYLAPHLVSGRRGEAEVVALDLPGHGRSSHKPTDGPPILLSEALYYVSEAIDKLGWNSPPLEGEAAGDASGNNNSKVTLVGHSMGGGICMAYAATFPEQVDKLVMIDVYGPLSGEADKTTSTLRSHIESRKRGRKAHRIYPSLGGAVETRRMTAAKAPGNQSLSFEAATALVDRAAMPAVGGDGYQFRHDGRLLWPSIQYLMPEQVEHMMKAVECPVCIVAAENGWPFKPKLVETALQLLDPAVYKVLPGSHHLHADPESAELALEVVYDFVADKNLTFVI